ncbi:MAG: hypothetical protein B7Z55_12065, partial [Planctomycetales bacterium 12-60-4]
MKTQLAVSGLLSVLLGAWWLMAAEPPSESMLRNAARKKFQEGNFAEAFDAYKKLVQNPDSDPVRTAEDVPQAIQALQNLGRVDEVDGLLSGTVDAHAQHWRVLRSAAVSLQNIEHFGHVVAGEFSRGHRRGGGEFVSSADRDHVTAVKWLLQALPLVADEPDKDAASRFYIDFAQVLRGQSFGREAWKLQLLTDVTELPDYEPGGRWWGGGETRGAPVDTNGEPLLYAVPESFAAAVNDGQRWRWLLTMAKETNAKTRGEVDMEWARFLESQFSVTTLAGYLGTSGDDEDEATGPFAVHTLKDNETIARLATGVKRFELPAEYHHLAQYRAVADSADSAWNATAADAVASIYENRRQYVKAAAAWKASLDRFGADESRQQRFNQIVGNWGQFEGTSVQPAGTGAELGFRFRNAQQVSLTAHAIKVTTLLDDVKAYLKGNPNQIDWQQINIGDIGYRLVTENQTKYLGAE